MSESQKRIEMVKLLQATQKDGESPGDTILRALRLLATARDEQTERVG